MKIKFISSVLALSLFSFSASAIDNCQLLSELDEPPTDYYGDVEPHQVEDVAVFRISVLGSNNCLAYLPDTNIREIQDAYDQLSGNLTDIVSSIEAPIEEEIRDAMTLLAQQYNASIDYTDVQIPGKINLSFQSAPNSVGDVVANLNTSSIRAAGRLKDYYLGIKVTFEAFVTISNFSATGVYNIYTGKFSVPSEDITFQTSTSFDVDSTFGILDIIGVSSLIESSLDAGINFEELGNELEFERTLFSIDNDIPLNVFMIDVPQHIANALNLGSTTVDARPFIVDALEEVSSNIDLSFSISDESVKIAVPGFVFEAEQERIYF